MLRVFVFCFVLCVVCCVLCCAVLCCFVLCDVVMCVCVRCVFRCSVSSPLRLCVSVCVRVSNRHCVDFYTFNILCVGLPDTLPGFPNLELDAPHNPYATYDFGRL